MTPSTQSGVCSDAQRACHTMVGMKTSAVCMDGIVPGKRESESSVNLYGRGDYAKQNIRKWKSVSFNFTHYFQIYLLNNKKQVFFQTLVSL